MIITFCGHSNYLENINDKEYILNILEDLIKNKDVDFYIGGYGNFDYFALKCAKKYKEKHLNTRIIFITPYLGKWLEDRKNIINKWYDMIIYPELEKVPYKYSILKRNKWMVDKSDYIIGYVKNHFGGAYKMLNYAKKQKKDYINIYRKQKKLRLNVGVFCIRI